MERIMAKASVTTEQNVYKVKNRTQSTVNILLWQVGLCLLVSFSYLMVQTFSKGNVLDTVREVAKFFV